MKEIPFFKHSIDTAEINQVGEVLDQKGSSKALMLEENFKKYIGCKYAVSTSSGTAAMHSAMCALDLKRGDKIVCSVNSFPSIAEVVRHFDAEPIFVDIDKDDFNIDPEKLDQTLTNNITMTYEHFGAILLLVKVPTDIVPGYFQNIATVVDIHFDTPRMILTIVHGTFEMIHILLDVSFYFV